MHAGSSPVIAGHWSVVIVGGRIAGSTAAWALAPFAESVLVVDASQATTFWPQQSTWDRDGNLLWAELGLLDTVLACGAPKTHGHSFRGEDGAVTEIDYPSDDAYSFRMSVPREVLDPALARAAQSQGNVVVVRPAKARDVVMAGGRVTGATIRYAKADHLVTCDLLVLADGRLSRTAAQVGAEAYRSVRSPWFALLAYYQDLDLPPDRSYFSLQAQSVVIATPCGDRQWCIATDMRQTLIEATGPHPSRAFARILDNDPTLRPALAAGRRLTSVGGAGKLRMVRRPMSGPGWCLVGDSGYFLDPVVAQGTRCALLTTRILRDRIAKVGGIDGMALSGLTEERDAALEADWAITEEIVAS